LALRVLHCPANVGNHPFGLTRAERELGLESWCVDVGGSAFAFGADEVVRASTPLAFEAKRWRLLRRALRDYDVVHFNFGRSILPAPPPALIGDAGSLWNVPGRLYARTLALRDLPLLKRAGKTIAVTFQGDDVRQGSGPRAGGFHRRLAALAGPGYYTPRGDARKRRTIAAWERYADLLYYVNPDLGAFLPRRARFVPYAHVDAREWPPAQNTRMPDVPTVVHAPSHRGIKGTRYLLDAVSRLQREGVAFDFRLVEGLPYAEARAVYAAADVLVDQLFVGWYGGLAVEFMALEKPVVCFVDEATASAYSPPELVRDLPLVRATHDDVYDVLRDVLTTRRDEYGDWSRKGRAFVERWHDPLVIAAGIGDDYLAAQDGHRPRSVR